MKAALLCLALVACSPSARLKTLDATLAALDSAEIGLVSFDHTREQQIVADATTKPDGEAQLKAYRAKRAEVLKALVAAYTALSQAFTLDNDVSLANAITAATVVETQLKGLGL